MRSKDTTKYFECGVDLRMIFPRSNAYFPFCFSVVKVEATGHCLGFAELQSPFVEVLCNGLHILGEGFLYSLPYPGVVQCA